MAIRKIKLSFSSLDSRDVNSVEISDELLKRCISESRWRRGTALMNGRKILVECFRGLDESIYRLMSSKQQIAPECIEAFRQDEFIHWRDGEI